MRQMLEYLRRVSGPAAAVLAGLCCAATGLAQAPARPVPAGTSIAATPTMRQETGGAHAQAQHAGVDPLAATLDTGPKLHGSETTTAIPLKITMTPSETPLKIGSTSNMAATIQNISNLPVSVSTTSLLLTTPAIVGGKASKCVVDIPQANILSTVQPMVTLQPQDSITVLFNLSQPPRYAAPVHMPKESDAAFQQAEQSYRTFMTSCNMGWSGPLQRVLDFSPGNYDYYLQGQFTLCTDMKEQATNAACSQPLRNFSASASFPVGIDQTTIVIFAILGGWLALFYVVFSKASQPGSILHDFNSSLLDLAPEEKSSNPVGRFLQKLMTSSGAQAAARFLVRLIATSILSAAVTVISSRISNPSLPIRINVMDAWGAMTMGFLSYFLGAKFISSLTDWSAGGSTAQSAPSVAAPTAPAALAAKEPEKS